MTIYASDTKVKFITFNFPKFKRVQQTIHGPTYFQK